MRLSLIVAVFLVAGLVSGFIIGSFMNTYTTTIIVGVSGGGGTQEIYITVERTITMVKPTTSLSLRVETVTSTVTSTIFETVYKTVRSIDTSCLIFKTSRNVYKMSEDVVLVLRNNCDYVLILPNSAPWLITSIDDKIIYSPIALQVVTDVRPGGEIEWVWSQRDGRGEQVSAGTYYAKLFTISAGILITEFKIIEA